MLVLDKQFFILHSGFFSAWPSCFDKMKGFIVFLFIVIFALLCFFYELNYVQALLDFILELFSLFLNTVSFYSLFKECLLNRDKPFRLFDLSLCFEDFNSSSLNWYSIFLSNMSHFIFAILFVFKNFLSLYFYLGCWFPWFPVNFNFWFSYYFF